MSGVGSTNAMKKGSANNPFLAFSEADMAGYLNSAYTGCIVKYSGEAIKRQISDINKTVGEYAQNLVFDTTKLGIGAIELPAAIKIDITKNGSSTTQYIYDGWVKDGKVYTSAVTGSSKMLVLASSLNSGADLITVINDGRWQRDAVNDQGKVTLWPYSEDVLFTVIPDANGSLAPFERFVSIVPYIVGELYKVVYGDGVYYYEEFYYISEERTTGNSDYIAPGKTMYDFTGSLQTGNGSKVNPYIANTADEMNSYLTTAYRGAFIKYVGTSTDDYTKDAVYQMLDDGDTTRYAILPTLENEGTASDLAAGKQLINSQGEVVEGTAGGEIDYTQDVMFWDYDGTLIYSCTIEEARSLAAFPTAPDHSAEGLTFRGWNWTLEDLHTIETPLDVGALYKTSDENTHIFIELDKAMTFQLSFTSEYASTITVNIDWGDGNKEDFGYTPSYNTQTLKTHAYTAPGKYEIIIINTNSNTSVTRNFKLGYLNSSGVSYGLCGSPINTQGVADSFTSIAFLSSQCVKKVYLGERCSGINVANCHNCSIKAGNAICAFYYEFVNNIAMKHITLSSGSVNSVGKYMMYNSNMETFSAPKNVYLHYLMFRDSKLKRLAIITENQGTQDRESLSIRTLRLVSIGKGTNYKYTGFPYLYYVKKATITASEATSTSRCSIEELTLAENCTNITAGSAFIEYSAVKKLIVKSLTPPALTNSFTNIQSDLKIYVPAESVDTYKSATGWSGMADRIYPLSELT